MLFTVRHKTYAGQVQDVLMQASSLERVTAVATFWCKKGGHALVFIRPAVIADESVFAQDEEEVKAEGVCPRCGYGYKAGEVVELAQDSREVVGHRVCPESDVRPLLAIVAVPEEEEEVPAASASVPAKDPKAAGKALA